MPGLNNRVYFACLGIAKCNNSTILNNVISAELGTTININNIIAPGSSATVGIYSDLPQVDFSYTEYLQTFGNLSTEYGLNEFVGFNLAIGYDWDGTNSYAGLFSGASAYIAGAFGSPPHSAVGVSFANLTSISYSLPVDGFFTTTRSYRGYSKTSPTPPSLFTESSGKPKRRQCFKGYLPAKLSPNAIQSIEITYTINRTAVGEFATRKPYASYVNYPIETTVNFEILTQHLDSYAFDALQTACKNVNSLAEDIIIEVEDAGELQIGRSYLTSLKYGGASANSNDNQTLSATYTSYEPITNLKPVIITSDVRDPCAQ